MLCNINYEVYITTSDTLFTMVLNIILNLWKIVKYKKIDVDNKLSWKKKFIKPLSENIKVYIVSIIILF